jgi:tricorn protease
VAGDLLTFVAEDDAWPARLDEAAADSANAARAWRLTSDSVPVPHPRPNPAGTHVAWSSTRTGASEAYAVAVDGGPINRLTYWAKASSGTDGVRGRLSDTEVLFTGSPDYWMQKKVWACAVPLDGPARLLPYGPTADAAVSPDGAVLLSPVSNLERAPAASPPPPPRLGPETFSTQNREHE